MKKKLINSLLFLVSISVSIIAAEVVLRIIGYKPWPPTTHEESRPIMSKDDPILGWKSKEGQYISPPYHPDGSEIQTTLLKTGLRKTYKNQKNIRDNRPKMIFVGGSFTQGHAISDHETFAWKVQKYSPSLEVLNYGTGGYGTYQSLLNLEQILPNLDNPKIVLYGFIQPHEVRNVGNAGWLSTLSLNSKKPVFVPYATIDKDHKLVRHQPESYTVWPVSKQLAISALIEKAFLRVISYKRTSQKMLITQEILLQIQELCDNSGSEFVVVMLQADEKAKENYTNFLEKNSIKVVDCAYPLVEEMRVKGEGHPNGEMNSKWASCIKDFI